MYCYRESVVAAATVLQLTFHQLVVYGGTSTGQGNV